MDKSINYFKLLRSSHIAMKIDAYSFVLLIKYWDLWTL